MAKRVRYLTDAELEIMRLIWDSQTPIDSTKIHKELVSRDWALSTLMGALKRLEVKGYVKRDESGYRILYSANISESQYLIKVMTNIHEVHNILNIKPVEIVTSLFEQNILSLDHILEIRSCLENIITNSKND